MQVVITADLHYGVGNNQQIVKNFSKKVIGTKADVLLLVGDTFAFNQQLLVECLKLFAPFEGDRLFVAGNHDLWTRGTDSLKIYGKTLLWITKQCGFHYLDQKPFTKEKVGFVGNKSVVPAMSTDRIVADKPVFISSPPQFLPPQSGFCQNQASEISF